MKKIFIFAITILLFHRSFAQDFQLFSNKDFSVNYPATWRVDTSRQVASAIMFFSPLEGAADKFDENVNVLTQDLRGQHIDLEAYKTITENQMAKMATDPKIIKSVVEKTPAGNRYFCEYLMTYGGNNLHLKAICLIRNETAYLITLTTQADNFTRYDAAGTQMLESFKLN